MDDSCCFTRSQQILLDHQRLKRMNARDLKDLIQSVLHQYVLHERLMPPVEDGHMNILDMWQECNGVQDARFFKSRVEVVLLALLADERLKGCQFYVFKEYKNANGDRVLGGHANVSGSN